MSFAGLTRLFQAFPRLRTLRLLAVEWLPHRPERALPDTTRGSLANLTTLDISQDIHVEPLVDWLLKVSAHEIIRRLNCSIATRLSATAIRTFLNASGTLLDHLSITLIEARDPTANLEATQLDLSTCTGLQSLSIPCSRSRTEPSSRSLSWVLILLSKNALSGIRSRIFDIDDTKATSKCGGVKVEALLRQRVPTASAQRLVRLDYRC
ncbi:hypothetical protein LXA43DRAFT_1089113 [Ganoderma leucocontextum]|nr:hypothetical protein LXA43DRAFT_1089113 [Ganoderma leucocontextum]